MQNIVAYCNTPQAILNQLPCRAASGGDSEKECYICLAQFEEGDMLRTLPCQHEFHCACIDKWLLDVRLFMQKLQI